MTSVAERLYRKGHRIVNIGYYNTMFANDAYSEV